MSTFDPAKMTVAQQRDINAFQDLTRELTLAQEQLQKMQIPPNTAPPVAEDGLKKTIQDLQRSLDMLKSDMTAAGIKVEDIPAL
ncbi:hypothetical protein Dda_2761 [Drechslerella dactyloides]|uniref:Uncharacterized protein n=1 Tax=Drechslerella dactyloides TaxID=74499 RepID=A0AAD6J122_DREDA|nr:hypothetical protein Dda_2761 [Drechslerella dactyloides]